MSTTEINYNFLSQLTKGIPLDPLPPASPKSLDTSVRHAPNRKCPLSKKEKALAVQNALRYIPSNLHSELEGEFVQELEQHGHIYMYRFLPQFPVKAYPIQYYPAQINEARALMLMIFNNLDPAVAQYPHELITYGGNGQVFSNWAQFWLVMKYLSEMTDIQTLPLYSGHPLGLFPSKELSPRMVVTNGMVIPNYSSQDAYDKFFALGVTIYGQMTAGSFCNIGPQGIVHGTTMTLLNAGRKFLNSSSLRGKVFVSSGLGGMSGAQSKAACIAGCIGVIAEVNLEALKMRHSQGWLLEIIENLDTLIKRIQECRKTGEVTSIGYHGNVVALWERLAKEREANGELLVDLGSDQTSLHNPFGGGYYPVQVTFDEAQVLMVEKPKKFKKLVRDTLRRHVAAVNRLVCDNGMKFWDYGNAFLLETERAGADVKNQQNEFIFPTYVDIIIGDIFSLGFGPFRWVCCSGHPSDLEKTDQAAVETLTAILTHNNLDPEVRSHYEENLKWIQEAGKHNLVVGSQARLLYSDHIGRTLLGLRFNELIERGELKGPVVITRDHHDVGGTDCPFRETSNVKDGSKFTADMAVQNVIGDGVRGATWVALHNGGGVGWGEVINGGFGLLLNGKNSDIVENLLLWDVNNGIARRAWAGNENALKTIQRAMKTFPSLKVTLPNF